MGESTEKSRGALAAHAPTSALAKPIQKVAPTVQINKENAAPNSVQTTSTRSASRGLAARSTDSHHGLSSGPAPSKKSDHAPVGLHIQTKEESLHRHGMASHSEVPQSASKSSRSAEVTVQKEQQVVVDTQLSHEELDAKSQAVYDYLTTKTPFKDEVSKWLDYLRAYCEKRSYGTDVLRGVLNRSLQGKPEWQKSEKYFELWRYWALRLPAEDQLDAFKMIEKYSIGLQQSALYVHLATLRLDQRDLNGALKVLETGQARGAEPNRDLEIFIDKIRASQPKTPSAQYHSGSLSAALNPSIPPSTPQHALLHHMDLDGTPSAHFGSTQPKSATASKPRSVSTPANHSNFESSTPSPSSVDAANPTGASSTASAAAQAKLEAAKRRSSASTLGKRLGVTGGAVRMPKASSATTPATPSTAPSQPQLATWETNNTASPEDPTATDAAQRSASVLAPIQEDSAMQVDEQQQQQQQHIAASLPTSEHSGHSNMMQLDSKAHEGPFTGKSGHMTTGSSASTTNGFCSTGGPLSSSTASSSTSTSSSTATMSSVIPTPQHPATNSSSTSAVMMRQMAQAIPSRISPPAQEPTATPAPIAPVLPPKRHESSSSAMVVSEPSVTPSAPVASFSAVSVAMAVPSAQSTSPSLSLASSLSKSEEKPTDPVMESAQAAAKALGRELFIVRGKPYINLQAIGKGGTCSVYKVMDPKGNIWALKVITWTAETVEVVKGYNDEVKLLELVQGSPYVVKLIEHELVATANTMYIMFEFAETDLRRLFVPLKQDPAVAKIVPGGRFGADLDALRYYWRSMLSAVLVLHKQRIVHLDLKPANFVLVEGRVKIIDFGIAKKVLNDTMHAKVEDIAGTILYMAPETLRQPAGRSGAPHKVGFPADVWSMGCILFQMVYGYTPFEHVSGLMPKIAAITANDPIQLQPIDNEDLMDCLRLCLDKTFEHRPTIADLLNHPFLGGCLQWVQP